MQQTCKMSDVFLQVLFHSSVYLIFRLLLKNRIMIILMANSNHTCLLVSRRTPVSGINCVFSFVIFNSITSPRAASIRCFMTAVYVRFHELSGIPLHRKEFYLSCRYSLHFQYIPHHLA